MRILRQQLELQIALGDELVQLLLRLHQGAHLPLQILVTGHRRPVDTVTTGERRQGAKRRREGKEEGIRGREERGRRKKGGGAGHGMI